MRLSEIFDDVEAFYERSGMHEQNFDTIAQARIATSVDDERRFQFTRTFIEGKDVLDFGCGNGGYLIRAQRIAHRVHGVELEKVMCDALQRDRISCSTRIDGSGAYDVITLFHVLEHLAEPLRYLEKLKQHLKPGGMILVEVPNVEDALLSLYQSAAFADFTYWYCHIYMYSNITLCKLAEKAALRVKFIRQIQRYPLSNHLFWLSSGKPNGHKEWGFLRDDEVDRNYGDMLSRLGIADTILAGLVV